MSPAGNEELFSLSMCNRSSRRTVPSKGCLRALASGQKPLQEKTTKEGQKQTTNPIRTHELA